MRPLILIVLLAGCASKAPQGLLGAYRLDDGRTVSIRRSIDETLRYRVYEDGASGRLYPAPGESGRSEWSYVSGPGFSEREPIDLTITFRADRGGVAREFEWLRVGRSPVGARRIGTERTVIFDSDGIRLFGRLHLPDTPPPYPAVVLVHGSGDSAATDWYYNSDFLVANGIAAFVYDKRGSGRSGGEFTFDFEQLARDVVAAVESVGKAPEIDSHAVGLSGYSQGAWVAPLAASLSDSVSFVIVNYGMIESPAEEARLEMRQLLVDAQVSEADLQDADVLIRAAIDLVASRFESGWPEFEELKRKHREAPWVQHLHGTPVGQLMSYPRFLVGWIGKRRLPKGLNWYYDSTELLESPPAPMVWLLAGQDRSAPNGQTIAKLRSLEAAGKPIRLRVFPDADHGMLTFTESGGERVFQGYAKGYFRAEVEAAKGLAAGVPARQASN